MTLENEKKGNLAMPIAIVIAGLIIAGAIMFSGDGKGVPSGEMVSDSSTPSEENGFGFGPIASTVGLDEAQFNACMEEARHLQGIQDDYQNATDTGGTGTPWSFVLGPNGEEITVNGAQPKEVWNSVITALNSGDLSSLDSLFNDPDSGVKLVEASAVRPVDDTDLIRGDVNAAITIIEYSDTECPFCARVHETLKEITAEYGDTVSWVYRHFPLAQIHPTAVAGAHAIECAKELGGNDIAWTFTDAIYAEMN